MIEKWRGVDGYDGLYQVSNTGCVRSLDRVSTRSDGQQARLKGKLLKQFVNSDGYYHVKLYNNGIKKTIAVHRLVALSFIKKPDNYDCVNHKDKNKKNNFYQNLEWCTKQYNSEYSLAKKCIFISPGGEIISVFNIAKFCRNNNLIGSCMCRLANGSLLSHKGWRRYE